MPMNVPVKVLSKLLMMALCSVGPSVAQSISTVAGGGTTYLANNTPASYAKLYGPTAVAVDANNNFYFADCNPNATYGCVIYKVTVSTNTITIVAGTNTGGYTGDGGQATSATFSNKIYGLSIAPSGNIYISDAGYCVIRKVTVSTGVISTYAGSNSSKSTSCGGFGGDGGAPTSAFLYFPTGIYTSSTALWIADQGNHRVREVLPSGKMATVAGNGTSGYLGDGGAATSAELVAPTGVTADSSGNIYITDQGVNNSESTVRRVLASTGVISTYAGGTGVGSFGDGGIATSARLDVPKNLALDSSGNLFIADTYNQKIREVLASNGYIQTYVGTGSQGFTGDGGAAVSATLNLPYATAVDANSVLYIADFQNARIRSVR